MTATQAVAEYLFRTFGDPLDLDWNELSQARRDIWRRKAERVLLILAEHEDAP